jgi:hypothetical protein
VKHPFEYPAAYFEAFDVISRNKRGERLNESRVEFVESWWDGGLLDVGIGSGAFIMERGMEKTKGYDVADSPRAWLKEKGLWRDPFDATVRAVTLWDSLEHMNNPKALIARVTHCLFISTPIYENAEVVLRSRHFKPREHLWYFTEWGLIGWLKEQGWELLERSRLEERFGRDSVGSYVFARDL